MKALGTDVTDIWDSFIEKMVEEKEGLQMI